MLLFIFPNIFNQYLNSVGDRPKGATLYQPISDTLSKNDISIA